MILGRARTRPKIISAAYFRLPLGRLSPPIDGAVAHVVEHLIHVMQAALGDRGVNLASSSKGQSFCEVEASAEYRASEGDAAHLRIRDTF